MPFNKNTNEMTSIMKLLLKIFVFVGVLSFAIPAIATEDAKTQTPPQKIEASKNKPAEAKPTTKDIAATPVNYTGKVQTYKATEADTLLTIGQKFGLGYVELRSANPTIDPWHPGAGTFIIIPTIHLLPDAPRKGIVVNLSEMRLYYYSKDGIKTYPIGVGREGFSTPIGTTSVTHKVIGPVWTPTDRMRREDPTLPAQKGPGPDNPLGTHALYLGWPQYLLHGTNKPWGIGRRVSSGCVRMYNEDAQALYKTVPEGTMVTVVRQAIKFGWVNNMLFVEAHPDDVLADQVERGGYTQDYKVPADIFSSLSNAAGKEKENIDWQAVREALKERRGYPVPILNNPKDDQIFITTTMKTRSGTSRFGPRLTQETVLLPKLQQTDEEKTEAAPVKRKRKNDFNG
jgi:L,D-transpeptidase ErfK/SrfK